MCMSLVVIRGLTNLTCAISAMSHLMVFIVVIFQLYIAVHGPNYENSVRESVYVGLYNGSGGKKHLTQDAKRLPTYTMFCREHFSCK